MSALDIWLAIAGMVVVTFVTRAAFLLGGPHMRLPLRLQRALGYVPAAAVAAVILPGTLWMNGRIELAPVNHGLYAMLAGLAWFLWRRSMTGTIVVGMTVFTLLRLFQ